jgi:hypothetical protein
MPEILTTSSMISCPHGGRAILSSSNHHLLVDGDQVLLESDVHKIIPGTCPWYDGSTYSPCVRILWSKGSNHTKKNQIRLLTKTSLGKCYNANEVLQGSARILLTQHEVYSNS